MRVPPTLASVMTLVYGLGFVTTGFFALMSMMMFDAPGSEDVLWTQLLALSVLSVPTLMLLSIVLGWVAWYQTRGWAPERGRLGRALRVGAACLPIVGVAFFAVALALLQIKCGGSFSCRSGA